MRKKLRKAGKKLRKSFKKIDKSWEKLRKSLEKDEKRWEKVDRSCHPITLIKCLKDLFAFVLFWTAKNLNPQKHRFWFSEKVAEMMETGWFVMKQEKAERGRLKWNMFRFSLRLWMYQKLPCGLKSLENQRHSEMAKQVMMRSISAWDG